MSAAHLFKQLNSALGKILCACGGLGQGQLCYKVCPALHGVFCPYSFFQHGRLSALRKVAAHSAKNQIRAVASAKFKLSCVPVVKRVVFAYKSENYQTFCPCPFYLTEKMVYSIKVEYISHYITQKYFFQDMGEM